MRHRPNYVKRRMAEIVETTKALAKRQKAYEAFIKANTGVSKRDIALRQGKPDPDK